MKSLRDKETLYSTKQEGDSSKASASASTNSRQWSSGLKNPRIVRVSRSFGGKDRHSKVCTIKGLRDRRIRLSVPTAIQLYDLQDRLGLSQPSKVIDWLLDNTKHDIDKLPPLPIIPGSFTPFHQPLATHTSHGNGTSLSSSNTYFDASLFPSRRGSININSQSLDTDEDQSLLTKLKYWDSNAIMRSKQKEDENQGAIGDSTTSHNQVSAQNFFPIASGNASILPHHTLLSNHHMFNYYNWGPSSLSLTQLGSHGLSSENDHHNRGQSSNSASMPPPLALSSGSQLFLSPSMATSSLFPPHSSYMSSANHQVESDIIQLNRFHSSNPFSQSLHNFNGLGLKPFPLSMSHHQQLRQSDEEEHQGKTSHSPWKESSRD